MNNPVIQFLFSCGFRCYSPDALKFNGLRKMAGPLDYIFVDLETAFKLITRRFDGFIHDIVEYKKSANALTLCYPKYSDRISQNFIDFTKGPIYYMEKNRANEHYFYNQMYLDDTLDSNLYRWKSICVFAHHNLYSSEHRATILRRCDRFNRVMDLYQTATVLFHITKIVTNIEECIQSIICIKQKYSAIVSHLVVIVCYDETVEKAEVKSICRDGIVFIFKPVETYHVQTLKYDEENSAYKYDYSKEIAEMKSYFIFELHTLEMLEAELRA